MNKKEIIKKTELLVKKNMFADVVHGWDHIDRVRKIALRIGKAEHADLFVVELAALLHDIGDYKFHGGQEHMGSRIAHKFLSQLSVSEQTVKQICHIVDEVSFKGAKVKSKMKSIEGKVVQDADKLDNLGAIGIVRTLTYGGILNRVIYDPGLKPVMHTSFKQYKNSKSTTVNHFYEKVLLLKDRMNTKTGKRMAVVGHKYIESFLKEFFREWAGER